MINPSTIITTSYPVKLTDKSQLNPSVSGIQSIEIVNLLPRSLSSREGVDPLNLPRMTSPDNGVTALCRHISAALLVYDVISFSLAPMAMCQFPDIVCSV